MSDSIICELIDDVMRLKLKSSQLVIFLYIAKKCCEVSFEEVQITTAEFNGATNLCRDSIVNATKTLSEKGVIRVIKESARVYKYSVIRSGSNKEVKEMVKEKSPNKTNVKKTVTKSKKKKGYGAWGNDGKQNFNRYRDVHVDEWNYDFFGLYLYECVMYQCKLNKINPKTKTLVLARGPARNANFTQCRKFLVQYSGEKQLNFVFKCYIEWFVKSIVIGILKKENRISSGHLSRECDIKKFVKQHNLVKNHDEMDLMKKLKPYKKIVKSKKSKDTYAIAHVFNKEIMDEKYEYGISSLLSEYGIVLSGNYLINCHNKTFNEAVREIKTFLGDININHKRQKSLLIDIVDKTCLNSPYYENLKFLNWQSLFSNVFSQLNGEFDTEDFKITKSKKKNNYKFLTIDQEKNEKELSKN